MKYIILALLMASTANASVGYGIHEEGLSKSLLVGDFSDLSPSSSTLFGYARYGIGRGQLMAGAAGTGLSAESNTGMLIKKEDGLNAGVELLNGSVSYLGTMEYSYRPGASAGVKYGELYAGPRVMYVISSKENAGVKPGAIIQLGRLTYVENPGEKIYNINLANKISLERRNADTYFFVFRSEL